MAKKLHHREYRGNLLRYLYTNRVTLRRLVNIMMRISSFALFFFFIGMYQRFTTPTQYMLLDISRYTATIAFITSIFIIILRIIANRYRRIRFSKLFFEITYALLILVLIIINSTLRVWLDGRIFIE